MTDKTRRLVLAGLAALPALGALPALALSNEQATALVQRMAQDIESTINSGRGDAAMFREFESLLERYADLPTIARFSLGPAARGASSADLRNFTAAFKTYISRKYGQRFREFIGGRIEVQRARAAQRGAVVVDARAILRGQAPIAVEFHASDRSGSAKVFNVIIEGVNLLTTERAEITALLDQQGGSIPALTRELQRRS